MSIGSSPSFTEIYTAINGSWPGTQISLDTNFRNVPFTDGTNTNSSSGSQLSLSQFRNKNILRDYILGSGTSRNTYHPVYSWYNISDSCQIYRNKELADLGLEGASIGSVAWEFSSTGTGSLATDKRSYMYIWCANIDDRAGASVDTGYRNADYSSSVYDTYGQRTYMGLTWRLMYNGPYNIPDVYNNATWINFNFGTGGGTEMEFIHEPGKSLAISAYSPYEQYISNGRYVAALGNGDTKLSSHYYTDYTRDDPLSNFGRTMTSSSYRPKVKLGNIGLAFGGRLIGGGDFR